MTRDTWLAAHPYLQPAADVQAAIEAHLARLSVPAVPLPDWAAYAPDFHAGVPLLQSAGAGIDLAPAEEAIEALVKTFEHEGHDGFIRYLGWAVLVRSLSPVVVAFSQWRDEERWLRRYCPTCGAAPAMGQLVGKDPGRLRLLSCGCCRTRWRYRRTGCPFCENRDDHKLAVLDVTGEAGLRIDYCESCKGYLKTYNGEGNESVLLADWTSLHLDVVARDRGLKRLAGSLYEL